MIDWSIAIELGVLMATLGGFLYGLRTQMKKQAETEVNKILNNLDEHHILKGRIDRLEIEFNNLKQSVERDRYEHGNNEKEIKEKLASIDNELKQLNKELAQKADIKRYTA